MNAKILASAIVLLAAVSAATAQTNTETPQRLLQNFPTLDALEPAFHTNYSSKLSLQPYMDPKDKPSDADVGFFKSLVWDHVTVHVEAKYTNTLSSTQVTGGTGLTPFSLTGVQFTPVYSVAYEAKIEDILTAFRKHKRAKANLGAVQDLSYSDQWQKVQLAYTEFEEARAEFLEAPAPNNCVAFHKMKIKAVAVLSMVSSTLPDLKSWLGASCPPLLAAGSRFPPEHTPVQEP